MPNGVGDTATFIKSHRTLLFIGGKTEVSAVLFADNASAFTITLDPPHTLTITGDGIMNHSSNIQNIIAAGDNTAVSRITFRNAATAGVFTRFLVRGGMDFRGNSDSGAAAFTLASNDFNTGVAGNVNFGDNASALNSTFEIFGVPVPNGSGGS